jgi:hypothetical protein
MFKYKTDAEVQAMTEQEANAVAKERTKRICKQKLLIQLKGAKEALEKNKQS